MVKVAILLTGQLRTWKICKIIIDKIKENNDVDLFLSIDKNNVLQNEYENNQDITNMNELNEAIKYYEPKEIFISSEYDDNNYTTKLNNNKIVYTPKTYLPSNVENIICEKSDRNIIIKNLYYNVNCIKTEKTEDLRHYKKIFEQYYIVYKAYELLEKYIEKTSTKYDIIMRLRFDQFIWNDNDVEKYNFQSINNDKNKILFNQHNMKQSKKNIKITLDNGKENTVQVFGGGCYKYYAYINDQFWCHKMDLIQKMKSFYEKLPDIINDCKKTFYPEYGCWIEHFFGKFLVENNIIIEKSNLDGVFIRQNFT